MMLKIRTNDDLLMIVNSDDLKISNLIAVLLESCDEQKMEEEIPLYNVSYRILVKIIEYTSYYNREPMKQVYKPLPNNDDLGVQMWYRNYLERLSEGDLYELLRASTYMDIEPLQELICGRIASLVRGKESDEIKQIFGLDYNL